jgi:hypothetical protein
MLAFARLVIWGMIFLPIWSLVWLVRSVQKAPLPHNCVTWAATTWDTQGGYLVIRWTRVAKWSLLKWPHFLWLPADSHGDLQHFVPLKAPHEHFTPPMFFDGSIHTGDPIVPDED